MTEAGPRPAFGCGYQSAHDRISVHVLQLLQNFGVAPDVEIVIPGEPELGFVRILEFSRGLLLQDLNCGAQRCLLRFTYQKMHMLGHEYVSRDHKLVTLSYPFQFLLEYGVTVSLGEPRKSSIATKGEEMEVRRLLIANETFGHDVGSLVQNGAGRASELQRTWVPHPSRVRSGKGGIAQKLGFEYLAFDATTEHSTPRTGDLIHPPFRKKRGRMGHPRFVAGSRVGHPARGIL